MPLNIRKQGAAPTAPELVKANQILIYAHGSAESLLTAFNGMSQQRGRGGPSHQQQDLLRAMLVFAGAGLDACAQQVVRDALPRLAADNESARSALIAYTSRKLRKQRADADVAAVDTDFLASLLLGSPEQNLVESLIDELTGSSMQSVEELKKVAAHLGVVQDPGLKAALPGLKQPFGVRNRIAHDMDIKFTEGRGKNRRARKRDGMVEDTNRLLEGAELLVLAVDKTLS